MSVGLVIVSHSGKIAEGVMELAAQMAPTTRIVPAGGTDDGGIGTSFDAVTAAIETADDGDGVVVLCDLGSAILTAETVLDFLDEDVRARVMIADAPLVEGSVAAAVAAEGNGAPAEVRAAAETARGAAAPEDAAPEELAPVESADASATPAAAAESDGSIEVFVTLVNASGLHARPAAELVKLASGFSSHVTVDGVDSRSLLAIMALGLRAGHRVRLEGSGADAEEAVAAIARMIESGFGET